MKSPQILPEPKACSIAHACATLDLSRSTLWKMGRNGQLRLIRIGRRTLVPWTEIMRLLGQD
jgi:excisionase family DNA binding protein